MGVSLKCWVAASLALPAFLGCGKLADRSGGDGGALEEDSGGGPSNPWPPAPEDVYVPPASPCQAGFYEGSFSGQYSSPIPAVGAGVSLTGTVQLTLLQAGSAQQTCPFEGESVSCSDVFTVHDGTISGLADAIQTAEGPVGGAPFFCTVTGALSCRTKQLEAGWIECTYCLGSLADGGTSCLDAIDAGDAGGGQFAGPLTAEYFYGTGGAGPSFGTVPPPVGSAPGAWTGSEALSDQHGHFYSGMGPLPDGGTLRDYISDAGYDGASGEYGGSGWWYAAYKHP